MAKIFLFGSYDIHGVPGEVLTWLEEYIRQGHEFIVGDNKGADSAFHKALSSLGADKVKIYSMGSAVSNLFDYPVRSFSTYYDKENKQVQITDSDNLVNMFIIDDVEKEQDIQLNKQWYEFKNKQLISDCDIAICLCNEDSKTTLHIIQLLNIYNKPVYTFTLK